MISRTILQAIRAEYNSGKKQVEIAEKYSMPQQIISRILRGERSVAGMRLETIEKMFPNAVIHLNGDTVNAPVIHAGSNCHNVVGINNGSCYTKYDCEERLSRIKDEIMDSDIPAEAKEKVYRIIKNTK